jgi:putative oxidoreductase
MDLALALLLARLLFGLAMAAHGAQKLFGWFGGYGLAGTAGFMESLGFRPGKLFTLAAGGSEFIGGLLIAFGLGGPIGPLLVIATMVVAIATVHLGKGFFAATNGPEIPLLYIALSVIFAAVGYGVYSLDALLGWSSFWTPAYVWGALVLGVIAGLLNLAVRRKAPQAVAEG